jgi:cellobiose transport system permease protein
MSTPPGRRGPRAGLLTYAALLVFTVVSLFPLVWTAIAASSSNGRLARTPPPFWFGDDLLRNLGVAWTDANMGRALLNTTVVAGTVAAGTVLFSTLAGFAFAKLRFRGRSALMLLVVATQAVPTELGVIPLYMMMSDFGWAGEIHAVIVPGLVTAFGVFFMRQYFERAVPDELLEAGRVDGCSSLRLYWHVVLPAARPAAAVLGLFTFMQAWNDFFWPLVVLTPENPTVQTALSTLASGYTTDYTLVLTAATIGTLPVLAVFFLFGRQIVGGIMQGALKG